MPFKQLSFEEEALNMIRSHYKTVDNHRRTSVALHGRPSASTLILAAQRLDQVNSIASTFPDSKRIQGAAAKFESYCIQHGLAGIFDD